MTQNKKTNKEEGQNKPDTVNFPAWRRLMIFCIITIIVAITYWLSYPAWSIKEQSQLQAKQVEVKQKKEVYFKRFSEATFKEIMQDEELMKFALEGGEIAFKENCVACHGAAGTGSKGFPNLTDDDWLWGGKIGDIYQTLLYGIRSLHEDTRNSQMPAFGTDKILTKDEIEDVAEYIMTLYDIKDQAISNKGQKIFADHCAICHGTNGKGNRSLGAPNLTDDIWLYGKNKEDIIHSITHARNSTMPNWNEELDNVITIKQLSIYVHSLGGGK